LVQATSANRPGYNVAVQNGLAASIYYGGIKYLDSATFTGVYSGNAATLFAAFKPESDTAYAIVDTSNNDTWWRYFGNGNAFQGVFRTPRVDNAYVAEVTGNLIYAITSNNTAYKVWSGGVSKLSTTGAFAAHTAHRVGSDFADSTSKALTGWIFEIVICNAVLSTADLNLLGHYLSEKWALSWSDIS
jgi:hypothetical protein